MNPNIGDKISRPKAAGFVQHVGIYLGNNHVFHNLPVKGEHISTLADFSAGQCVAIVERHPEINPIQLHWRIQERLRQPKPYHPTDYNCEHAANYVLHGKAESAQVQGWAVAAALVTLVAVLAK